MVFSKIFSLFYFKGENCKRYGVFFEEMTCVDSCSCPGVEYKSKINFGFCALLITVSMKSTWLL